MGVAHAEREGSWDRVPRSVLDTFEAIYPALSESVAMLPQPLDFAIEWEGPGVRVFDAADLRTSVERVGVEPSRAKVAYGQRVRTSTADAILTVPNGPLRMVEMVVWSRTTAPKGTSVTFSVRGEDVDTTHGFFGSAVNRIEAAVARLSRPDPDADAEAGRVPVATGWRGRLQALLRHPTGSQVVGGLVVAGIIALVGWALATAH